jgi:Fe-S-cluster-containing dehydrogenase component/formate-dependent nitrite reductase membrane component NrfD
VLRYRDVPIYSPENRRVNDDHRQESGRPVTNFAWVIDQTSCIGCHACTTACKSENEVPLGVNRTWVKYVERGTFPETRRDIAVLRCNHCADAPCVKVCPTTAMFKRADGIVDFDTSRCIGCKACIQACPYDAIYIDPEEHVAEKCNFCAHRVDEGLLPACVVVCPTESLIFGDIEDPASRAAQVIASRPTTVRRPEQGTRPQAYYVGASPAALDPLAPVHGDRYMWADRRTGGAKDYTSALAAMGSTGERGRSSLAGTHLPVIAGGPAPLGAPRGPEIPAPPPAPTAGSVPEAVTAGPAAWHGPVDPDLTRPGTRVAYDVFHPRPWGWKVALYLWTKGIGAGAFGLIFLAAALGLAPVDQLTRVVAATIALAGVGLTTVLLVADLKRPERFLSILYRPQRRSWLAIGAFILVGYSGLLGLWWLGTLAGIDDGMLTALGWPAFGLAVMTALYSMFLLRQCEARDLWQRPVVGVVLIAQATILGAAALIPALLVLDAPAALVDVAAAALLAGGGVNLVALLAGEAFASHPTANARAAAHLLVRGPFGGAFWIGGVTLGGILPLVVGGAWLAVSVAGAAAAPILLAAGLAAAAGLLWYELGFITAGQAVPIS